ncbi:MAG: hypothetical protein GOMPHAMPRED_007659 [Gomphillus americanus]|uniref:Cell wall mannoprotein PIR1-like C-terminal domain-containing protein n=1 Tax=Gomphillus americanus TaxID=1940652 RepID=A0A8H3EVJ8_9LECA|nr:MAG: hypothetical protein GOMPHAMPRED_007659 [Gomphillus americanus]
MKYSFAYTLAAIAIGVNGQGAPAGLAPSEPAPAGCVSSGTGSYEVTIVKPAPAAKRDIEERDLACGADALVVQLAGGVLTDNKGRIGSIVANRQFQFDGPPAQTGAIFDAGFSICPNTSIAIGPTTNFFQCLSGSFFNLYDQPAESNCSLVNLQVTQCTPGSGTGSSSVISQGGDGQPTASSAPYVSQTSDGQVQATSAAVVSQQSDGQPTASSAGVVSQISDGQPQATGASNATIPTTPPVATGGASSYFASGAFVVVGAIAALFL